MEADRGTGHGPSSTSRLTGCRLRDLTARQRVTALVLAVVVAAPFVIAAFQAHADGWYPIGDNGTMLTVARQVFSAHPPLTGEVASGTRYGGHPFHPGPMVYYVLAPFVAVFGGATGLLVGAAVVSTASVLLIGYVALRTAGPYAALWAWVTTLLMCWSLGGTAFLYPPFKTISALLVILLFLYTSAALVSGRSTLLPLWVLAASYPMAATMRYLLPIAAVAGVTAALVVAQRWRRATADPDTAASFRQRALAVATLDRSERRSVVIGALLAVACWWAPAYEAATNRGGNVLELYRASRAAAESTDGLRLAIGEQAKALLLDPVQNAVGFGTPATGHVVVVVLLMAAVGVILVRRHRLMGRARWAYVLIALAALVFMVVSLATTPADEGFGSYRTLAASPVGAFVVFAAGLVAALALRSPRPSMVPALRASAIGAVVLGSLAIAVPGPIDASTESDRWAYAATRGLVDEAAPLLQADGRWRVWVIGGRTTPTVLVGFKAGLEAAGVDTGIDSRAPGLGATLDQEPPPLAGDVLFTVSGLRPPQGDWTVVGTYDPPDRSTAEADETARQLVDFARQTNPRPLEAFVQTVPRFMCPELAPQGFQGDCPAAAEILATENPVAELPPAIVALVYLVQFGENSQFPVIDGPKPPQELLDAAAETWDDVPLTVYALRPGDS